MTTRSIQSETLELLEWQRLCQQVATFAATPLGQRAAQSLPIPDTLAHSVELLHQTREVYQLEAILGKGLNFEGVADIGPALERAHRGGILSGEELLHIAGTLAAARTLRRLIDAQSTEDFPTLSALVSPLRTYPELERQIHHCIDDRGKVTDRASDKLASIREQWKNQREQIYQKLNRILQRQSNALQELVITQRQDRFVLPVKASQKDAIPGLVHDSSGSGATLYIEPHNIVEGNNRLRQLTRQEEAESERIRQVLTEQVALVVEDLEILLAIVTKLDLTAARARYSYWLEGNPPRFIETGEAIVLRQLRHPLLLWQQRHSSSDSIPTENPQTLTAENPREVVPIDLIIHPQIRVVAITGPNTGGKTVTLKTLGLVSLMAKAGLFIPAKEPVELPWFGQVLADIGDEQSLQQNLSTFSGHIKRIGRILAALDTPDSPLNVDTPDLEEHLNPIALENSSQSLASALVLLDEVGAGTDPSEGSALARSLLQHLASTTQLTIATTHFGELKALKYQDPRFENASVEFDESTLSPTYRLLWGIPGRSNALTIAQRLGLADTIVSQAQTYVNEGTTADVNSVIAELERQRRRQEEKANGAAKLLRQTEHLYRELNRKAEQLKQREWDLKQQQEVAVQAAIEQAKAEIAGVIRKLQRGPQLAQRAKTATESLDRIAATQLPSQQPKPEVPKMPPTFKPHVGDRVRLTRFNQVADVIGEIDAQGEITVRLGLMKMSIPVTEIESLKGEKVEPEPAKKAPKAEVKPDQKPESKPDPEIRTSRNTLDLRGSRVADAEIEIDRALAEANGPLWIIHGHGTGKLRQGVQEFLKQHSRVLSFEAAAQSDGGTGVTLVRVKI